MTKIYSMINKKIKYNLYEINRCIHQKTNSHYSCSINNNKWLFDDQKEPKYIHFPETNFSDSIVG